MILIQFDYFNYYRKSHTFTLLQNYYLLSSLALHLKVVLILFESALTFVLFLHQKHPFLFGTIDL